MVQVLEKEEMRVSPAPLYQIAMGFMSTRALLAAYRVGIFEALAQDGKTASDIAHEKKLALRPTEMLLDACVSLRLCTKEGDCYVATPMIKQFLTKDGAAYLGHFFNHFNDHMYPAWFHLEETVRTGEPQMHRVRGDKNDHFFEAMDRSAEDLETFMLSMEEHSLLEGAALANAYDFSQHRVLLDVAGGTGAMAVAIVQRYPALRALVLERSSACQSATRAIESHGLSDPIRVFAGDMFKDFLVKDVDVILLSGTLHNWGPAQALTILKQCYKALPPGGTLLISEQVLDNERTSAPLGMLCSLNMLVMMGGQEYSQSEYEGLLSAAGFHLEEIRNTGGVRQLLVAHRQ